MVTQEEDVSLGTRLIELGRMVRTAPHASPLHGHAVEAVRRNVRNSASVLADAVDLSVFARSEIIRECLDALDAVDANGVSAWAALLAARDDLHSLLVALTIASSPLTVTDSVLRSIAYEDERAVRLNLAARAPDGNSVAPMRLRLVAHAGEDLWWLDAIRLRYPSG